MEDFWLAQSKKSLLAGNEEVKSEIAHSAYDGILWTLF